LIEASAQEDAVSDRCNACPHSMAEKLYEIGKPEDGEYK
jgi:hypothetical protein